MAYIILFLRRCQTIPANPPPRSINVESTGACVVEVVKAASAIVIDKNADAKMVLAKKSFFINYLVPRTHAGYKSGIPCYCPMRVSWAPHLLSDITQGLLARHVPGLSFLKGYEIQALGTPGASLKHWSA
jgi:hypothetical protein